MPLYPPASSGGGAPTTADYLVKTADAGLSAERVVTDSVNVTWDWATAGLVQADLAAYARTSNFSYNTDNTERNALSFTVNANDLSTNKGFLISMGGNILHNSGSGTSTWRVKLGATTLWGDAQAAYTNSATRRPWSLFMWIGNIGATNSQSCFGIGFVGGLNAASVAGLGEVALPGTANFVTIGTFRGTSAEDTTANKTLSVTHQFSVSNAAVELVVDSAFALLI